MYNRYFQILQLNNSPMLKNYVKVIAYIYRSIVFTLIQDNQWEKMER